MTFRALSAFALAGGVMTLVVGIGLLGEGPGTTPELRHLRAMKARRTAPTRVEPLTVSDFLALPHGLSLARRATVEARGVCIVGWDQRMLVARDGDVHLEITGAPRRPGGPDTAYVTGEITPQWRDGHPGWSYDALLEAFRPNRGGASAWDSGPRRVRVTGWLLDDYQFDHAPSPWVVQHAAPRVSGWEIHPVTRIEVWDEAHRAWFEVRR